MTQGEMAVCLMVHQRVRNKAIGINADPESVRGLARFARSANMEQTGTAINRMAEAALLIGLIEEYKALAKKVSEHVLANIDDADTRNEGVYVVKKLDSNITALADRLETLWQLSS